MKSLAFLVACLATHLLWAQHNVSILGVASHSPISDEYLSEDYAVSSFEMSNGMAIVRASVNGVEGNFILDTGSPGVVINSRKEGFVPKSLAAGIGGSLKVGTFTIGTFNWGIISAKELEAYLLDISHLEAASGKPIMGLIGYDVLKQYEVLFDYQSGKITVFKAGEATVEGAKATKSIPISFYGHVPILSAKVGGKRVYFGLDSGAGVNLLDVGLLKKLPPSSLMDTEAEFLIGLDQKMQDVLTADVANTVLKGNIHIAEMRYSFVNLDLMREKFGTPLDGLLGFPFFEGRVVSIDYAHKRLRVWE